MPHVEANGIQIYYEERGSGDPLICIMGITAPGAVWEAHVEAWQSHFRCIIGDNRGVGLTDKPEGPYTSAMMADDYAGLMDSLGIEKARVVGCSMGSIIAQQLALRHPEKVQSAVLMCSWARCDRYAKSVFAHMKAIKARLRPEEFMEYIQLLIFTKPFWDNDAAYQSVLDGRGDAANGESPQPLHAMEAQAAACTEHNTLDQLKDIKCPCFVIGGQDDIFTPRWMGEEVAAGIPNSDLHLYEGAGHAFHWECLDDFNPRTTDWLRAH
ncbi:MAG: alpha/beta fold hydrolase [Verrucomicrobiaceae bacterium]|nr:alpha/beta fold hydrolase [Verrucomicrobiaceae bacterium]NCF92530.1 alpha/beta fold hydrolase [Verrucomicrobiaceae bacterium]